MQLHYNNPNQIQKKKVNFDSSIKRTNSIVASQEPKKGEA